jgi:hypothetical protein
MDKFRRIISQFLPMILIFLFVKYPRKFAELSNSILGKLFAVIVIIFYVSIDYVYGLFVCLLIIFYYQTDFVERMCEGFENGNTIDMENGNSIDLENIEIPKDGNILYGPDLENPQEGFEELKDVYSTTESESLSLGDREKFCKVHCKNGHLINKGQIVKPEMSEHVFPEIESKDRCNICDPSCKFKMIENRFPKQK